MKDESQLFNAFFDGEIVSGKIVTSIENKEFIHRLGHGDLRSMQWRDAVGLNQQILSPLPGHCLMDFDDNGQWPILIRTLWIEQEDDDQAVNRKEIVYDDALVVRESIQGTYSAYELRITYSVGKIQIQGSKSGVHVLCRSHGFPDRSGLPPDCGIQHLRTHRDINGIIKDLSRIFRNALTNQRIQFSSEIAEMIEEDDRKIRESKVKAARQSRREYRRQRTRSTAPRDDHGKERRDSASSGETGSGFSRRIRT